MGVEFGSGWLELTGELERLADEFVDGGGEGINKIIKAGAEVVLEQAKKNCPVSPGGGTLKKALKIIMKKKGNWTKARIGVQKGSDAYYATFVEYGHGGPHPAGPHPFLSPAFDLKKEEAYGVIRDALKSKINKL
jgi:HK97 gp10 family phage protein